MKKPKINLIDYDEHELTWDFFCKLSDANGGMEAQYNLSRKVKPWDSKPYWVNVWYWLSGDGLLIGALRRSKDEPEDFCWKKLIDLREVSAMTKPVLQEKPQPFFWVTISAKCMEVVGEQFFVKRNPRHEAPIFPAFVVDYPHKEDKMYWEQMDKFVGRIKDKIYAYRRSENTD